MDFVKKYLVRGRSEFVSDQEILLFMNTCKNNKVNPLVGSDIYLIKYDKENPANIVEGKSSFIKRAKSNPNFLYKKDGIVVIRNGRDIVQKEGCCLYPGEELLGGWCKVFYKKNGVELTEYKEVSLSEYNKGRSTWKSMPATMINKVAVCQCLRESFPEDYAGIYTEDEMVASGAIPGGFKVDKETGECIPCIDIDENDLTPVEDEDPIVSKEQRQSLFRTAKTYLGEEASAIIKELCLAEGYESTEKLPVSVYDKILKNVMDIIQERGLVRNTEGEE